MARKTSHQTSPTDQVTQEEFQAATAQVTPKEIAIAAGLSSAQPGNGQNTAPPIGEPAEKPLPESASPPPPMPGKTQKVAPKLNLDSIRKNRPQMKAVASEAVRIPVTDSPRSDVFIRAHPTFGGLDDPMPIWKREGVGKSSGLKLVDPDMIDLIRAHGGKVFMAALYWCHYSVGGQILLVVNAESSNDWIVTSREIYELSRKQWVRRVNAGNCWDKVDPPFEIPPPRFADLTWDEVVNLAWRESVATPDSPDFLDLAYGGYLPPAGKE
jgi:hypothetical protein